MRHFYVIFAPGTQILLNLIPKLVGLPKFQPKRMSEMQFPNMSPQSGGCYIFQKPESCKKIRKPQTVTRSRQIADFRGAVPI